MSRDDKGRHSCMDSRVISMKLGPLSVFYAERRQVHSSLAGDV